jgi:hypothetical protein
VARSVVNASALQGLHLSICGVSRLTALAPGLGIRIGGLCDLNAVTCWNLTGGFGLIEGFGGDDAVDFWGVSQQVQSKENLSSWTYRLRYSGRPIRHCWRRVRMSR